MDNNNLPQQNIAEIQPSEQPVVYQQQPTVYPTAQPVPHRGKGLALGIVGMILGIESVILIFSSALLILIDPDAIKELIFGLSYGRLDLLDFLYYNENMINVIVYSVFAVIFALVSLIISIKGRSVLKTKVSVAGIVLSGITISVTALFVFFVATAVMA